MDEMDRTWELLKNRYQNRYFRICILRVKDLSEKWENLNGKVKFVIRIFVKVIHYLLMASFAYYLTRNGGIYYPEEDMLDYLNYLDPDVAPDFWYRIVWAIDVFLFMLVLFP